MNQDPFKEYIRQAEPDKKDKGYAWHTAIGLQDVDGLTPSKYLIDTAIQNIEGEITLDEAQKLLDSYYAENPDLYLLFLILFPLFPLYIQHSFCSCPIG